MRPDVGLPAEIGDLLATAGSDSNVRASALRRKPETFPVNTQFAKYYNTVAELASHCDPDLETCAMSTRRWGEDREDSDGKRAKEDGKLSKALMERPTVANYVTHEEKTIETQDREGK